MGFLIGIVSIILLLCYGPNMLMKLKTCPKCGVTGQMYSKFNDEGPNIKGCYNCNRMQQEKWRQENIEKGQRQMDMIKIEFNTCSYCGKYNENWDWQQEIIQIANVNGRERKHIKYFRKCRHCGETNIGTDWV